MGPKSEMNMIFWEVESETAFLYFVGDDGIECEGEMYAAKIVAAHSQSLQMEFNAKQFELWFCIPDEMNCTATLKQNPNDSKGSWSIDQLSCKYHWEN